MPRLMLHQTLSLALLRLYTIIFSFSIKLFILALIAIVIHVIFGPTTYLQAKHLFIGTTIVYNSQGQRHDLNFGKTNTDRRHKICNLCNLHLKYNITFIIGVENLYNFVILVVNANIKLRFFRKFGAAVAPTS